MPKETTLHGFRVAYDEGVYEGIKYLRDDLSYDEAKVFFDQAKLKGQAAFEDDLDRDYTLFYQSGVYTLLRRS